MHPDDLQEFIASLELAGELSRVRCSVDPNLEIATLVNALCKENRHVHALLFEDVKGHDIPLAINLYGSRKRLEIALGPDISKTLPVKMHEDLRATGASDSIAALRKIMGYRKSSTVIVDNADCYAVDRSDEGLGGVPAIKAWPADGGRYLTLGQVYTCHPETFAENCGMYRVQVVDKGRALLRCHPGSGGAEHMAAWHAMGEAMPVAIALGGPPVMTWLAGVSLPGGVSEIEFAGYLTGKQIKMVRCRNSHLSVPANAEIVIEGRVFPGSEMIEGPFGNHTGYYDCASPAPVICIDRVSMRNGAIYPCTLVGPPPRENCCLAELTERTLLPLLQYDHPWVVNVHMPVEGIFHRAAIVAVAPDCGLPQEKICTALRSSALLKNSRLLILVDKQDHLSDLRYIYWRVVNASRDNRTCHVTGHNILYDARLTGGSLRVDTSVAMESHVKARWHEYGLNATT